MIRRADIPHCNRSPYGWWIASYIERLQWDDEDTSDSSRRCLAWENTILIRAPSRDEAYRKAVATGRLGQGERVHNDRGRTGSWRFEGLTSLLPVYERLEDGAELIWEEHAGRSVRSIRAMVRRKQDLNTFRDTDPPHRSTSANSLKGRSKGPRRAG